MLPTVNKLQYKQKGQPKITGW